MEPAYPLALLEATDTLFVTSASLCASETDDHIESSAKKIGGTHHRYSQVGVLIIALVLALLFGAAGPAGAQSRVPWTILSTTTGGLPPANGGSEQTSCVVADIDRDGTTDFFITDRSVAPSVILYRRQAGGWQKCIVEATQLPIEA
ncbi:MAG: hypothetical protein MUF81_19835, partial [Verrucomicrobia bacterium]|nr:hypothetical protein [Verrucomicrobiota bacterium]